MIRQEKAPTTGTVNQGSLQSDLQMKLITDYLREILLELDADFYQCTLCISALAVGKALTPDDKSMMFAVARRVHGLARLQRYG